jgi:tetratricopeptide (TPR) repeat protein/serine/threonine protein kinase
MNDPSPLEAIFFAALERGSPQERAAYLDGACAGDPDLRRRVEKMLAAQAQAGSFLEQPARSPVTTADELPLNEGPGTVIGPYKLMEQIGEGGMGLVFAAEQQQPVRRKVALKVIKPGMDTRQVVARFEAERQALALMDHPNIAQVHDGGATAGGRPYFVMELVKGVPITEYCDQNQVAIRQRLELFLHVCQAIQHAHQKGIIHRDIKPSNVLVMSQDGTPLVKVIDFGVAKAIGQQLTDKTLYTQFAQLVGTPLYMSPEQAGQSSLDVDTRSDIYSLGVLLYELLTGTTPFDQERLKEVGFDEMRRIIREEEPPRPSTRISTLGLAASTVCSNRKSDWKQLSRLFRGELDWIVMKALEKDRNRRYETASAFAADVQRYLNDEPVQACPPSAVYRLRKFARRHKRALVVAGLVLCFIALLGGGGGWVLRDRAARAQRLTGQVQQLLDDIERLEREQKWPEALAAVERAEAALAGGEADDAIRQRVAEARRGLAFVARLDRIRQDRDRFTDGKPYRRQAARDYALAFREYGVDVEALPPEEAVARLQTNPTLAVPIAAALDDWAADRRSQSMGDPSQWKPLVAVARRLDPDPLHDRLRAAWGQPITPELQADLRQLTEAIDVKAHRPATIELLFLTLMLSHLPDPAIRILRDGQYAYPADFWLNMYLGTVLREQKDYAGAVRYASVAVALRPESAPALVNLGACLARQKKLDEGIARYQAAIGIDPTYAIAHASLGAVLKDEGMLPEALACCRKAIELDPNSPFALNNLGSVLVTQGKSDEAMVYLRKAIALAPTDALAHHNLAMALHQQKKLDEALAECRRGIDLDPQWASGYSNLGEVFRDKGMLPEAVANGRKAIDLDPSLPHAHYCLGNAFLAQKKPDEAIASYRKSLELNPKYADGHAGLGLALSEKKDLEGAIREFHAALKIDPNLACAHYNLGNALQNQGKLDEAIACFRKAIEIDPNLAVAHVKLGNGLRVKNDLEGAIREYRAALKVDPNDALTHYKLGNALNEKKDLEGAIREFEAALKIKPNSAVAHYSLGLALYETKDLAGAIRAYRNAIKIDPKYASAHNNLGNALCVTGHLEEGIREFHLALKIDPNYAVAHYNLGNALTTKGLHSQGKLDEAIAHLQKAIELEPKFAPAHYTLGNAVRHKGDLDGAVVAFRAAITLKPDYADAHNDLGAALGAKGRVDEAIAEFQEAIRLKKDYPEAHCNLGGVLKQKGEFRQALDEVRRGHELGSRQPGWRYPSAQWVREAEQLVALDAKLPKVVKGEAQPADSAEQLALAKLCQEHKKLYAAAVRFYEEAFAAEPKLMAPNRYNAACVAALAGCGQGSDAEKLDDQGRCRLRGQALAWLRADLAAWEKELAKNTPEARAAVRNKMLHWQTDADLAGVRGPKALAQLPEVEQQRWQKLWKDVADLLKRAQEEAAPEKKSNALKNRPK